MKCAVKIGSGAMLYVPSLVKIDSDIQTLIRRGYTDTQNGDHISLIYESRLKRELRRKEEYASKRGSNREIEEKEKVERNDKRKDAEWKEERKPGEWQQIKLLLRLTN
jgi:hypothetical protein